MKSDSQILLLQALSTPASKKEPESMMVPSVDQGQHEEDVGALVDCLIKDVGFSQGIPVAAFSIYKCLLHWKSFEADSTSVFGRLIQMIQSAIENQDSNKLMAYWLSNTSTLLYLIQRSFKDVATVTIVRKPTLPTSRFGRMTLEFGSSPLNRNTATTALKVVRPVEAKYPALRFKYQLISYVEKIYGIIRDNLKKELGSFLLLIIKAPKILEGSVQRSRGFFGKGSPARHWSEIIECLNSLLCTLKENFVPPALVQKIYAQNFSYINVQLFNSVVLRHECCTSTYGEYVKSGLDELELWCSQAKEEYVGSSWDELKHIRQVVGFLVIFQKHKISYNDITNDLCPILNAQQRYRICSFTEGVSADVIARMRILMKEDNNNAEGNSFMLYDNSSIQLSVEDLSDSFQDENFSYVKPAAELLENQSFQFLQECS